MKVKICGITNLDDALAAIDAGADALGFVFAKSKRQVKPSIAKSIIEKLPPWIPTVGVFQNESAEKIAKLQKECKFGWVQLHGNEDRETAAFFYPHVIKTIFHPDEIKPNYPCSGFLLDQEKEKTLMPIDDFIRLASLIKISKPLILAGGLTPENVEKARTFRIYGVDVARGVEYSPGKKDAAKVKEFIRNAKGLKA